jgi:hypothetical protein
MFSSRPSSEQPYRAKVLMPGQASAQNRSPRWFPSKKRARGWTALATACLLLPALVVAGAYVGFGGGRSNAAVTTYTLFGPNATPTDTALSDSNSVELGVTFSPDVAGYATGMRFYKAATNTGTHTGTLWTAQGKQLAQVTFTNETGSGWQSATFSSPVSLTAKKRYVVSYHATAGNYSFTHWYFKNTIDNGELTIPASSYLSGNGVYAYGSTSTFPTDSWAMTNYWVDVSFTTAPPSQGVVTAPSTAATTTAPNTTVPPTTNPPTSTVPPTTVPPTTAPPAPPALPASSPGTTGGSGGTPTGGDCSTYTFPGGSPGLAGYPCPLNTGVPAGATLTPYTGPGTITTCTTIDHKDIPFGLNIRATRSDDTNNTLRNLTNNEAQARANACVIITNSRIHGIVDTQWTSANTPTWGPLYMADDEVMGDGSDNAAITMSNLHIWRVYAHGNRSGMQCDGYCEAHDSYIVADTEISNAHMGGFITNGNHDHPLLLDHNSILCHPSFGPPPPSGAGCADDIGIFPDFSTTSNITITRNYLPAPEAYYCTRIVSTWPASYGVNHNLTVTNNVYSAGCGSATASRVANNEWDAAAAAANNDLWCNNTFVGGAMATDDEYPTKVIPNSPGCP